MSKKLYIIMPAYNEEENIQSTLSGWYEVIEKLEAKNNSGNKLVVINDGSKDKTLEKLKDFKKDHPLLEIIDKKNEGHGPSLIRGYNYAIEEGADWIFQTDSDGQTNPKEFAKFWKERKDYDAIFGHRAVRGDGKDRDFVEKTLCRIIRQIFKVKLPDANAPFRLMRSKYVKEFLSYMPEGYNLPNVILTTLFVKFEKRVKFEVITFKPRTKGKNSINIKKITKIGLKAIPDFKEIYAKVKKAQQSK